MLIFFLLTSAIMFTAGQYPYPYNRRIYGRRPDVRYVLRNPLRSFNPLPDLIEITTISSFNEKCVPPKNTCKYDYDCPSYHKCCQDSFCGYKSCKKIETTTKPEESNEITIKPECSPCVECVISQYRCDFDYQCPPCFTCCQDFSYVYKVCKHVTNATTAAVTTFSTIPTASTVAVTTEKGSSRAELKDTSTFTTTTAAKTTPTFSSTIDDLDGSGSGRRSGNGDGSDDEWDIDLRPKSRFTKGPNYEDFSFSEAFTTTTVPVENITFTTEIFIIVENKTIIKGTTAEIINVTSTDATTTISETPTTITEVQSTTPSWENTPEYLGNGNDNEEIDNRPVLHSTRRPTEENFTFTDFPDNDTETNITTIGGSGSDDEDFETHPVTRSTRTPTEEDFTFTDIPKNTTDTDTTTANNSNTTTFEVSTTASKPEAIVTTLVSPVTTKRSFFSITPVEDFGRGSGDVSDDEDLETGPVTRSTRRPTEEDFIFTDIPKNTTDTETTTANNSNTTTFEVSTTASKPEAIVTTLIYRVTTKRRFTSITSVEDFGTRDDEIETEGNLMITFAGKPREENFLFNETKSEVVTPSNNEFVNIDGQTFIKRDDELLLVTPTESDEVETISIPTTTTSGFNMTEITTINGTLTTTFLANLTEAFTIREKLEEVGVTTTVQEISEFVTTNVTRSVLEEEKQPEEFFTTETSAPVNTSKENTAEMFTDQEGSGSGDDLDDEEI